MEPPARSSPSIVLSILVAATSFAFVPEGWGLLPAGVALLLGRHALRRGDASNALFGVVSALLCGFASLPGMMPTWPLPLLAALGVGAVLVRFVPALSGTATWWARGRIRPVDLALALVFICVPSIALVGWQRLQNPELGDVVARIPALPLPLLVLAGLGFSMVNALAEETFFRGLVTATLERAFGRPWIAFVLQALSFGLIHIHGVPRGWTGVALAVVYGAMMGELRRRTKGLLLAWFAHVFTDCVIFGTLAVLAAAATP
jgi:uncharacterized protein